MKVIKRNPWATLYKGLRLYSEPVEHLEDVWGVSTIDDDVEGPDHMNTGTKDNVLALFRREITIDEFYEA